MKKIIIAALSLTLLVGCSAPASTSSETSTPSEAPVTTQTTEGSLEVSKEGDLVQIDLPKSFVDGIIEASLSEDATAEDVLADMQENNPDAVLNDDGSITLYMTQTELDAVLNEYKKGIDESIQEIINDETGAYTITSVTYNDNMSKFTVTCSSTPTIGDSFSSILFLLGGMMYNAFNGTPNTNILVDYVDEQGNVIDSTSSQALIESANSEQ